MVLIDILKMKKAAAFTLLRRGAKRNASIEVEDEEEDLDLNIFVVTFNGMKEAEKNISGGDPY